MKNRQDFLVILDWHTTDGKVRTHSELVAAPSSIDALAKSIERVNRYKKCKHVGNRSVYKYREQYSAVGRTAGYYREVVVFGKA